MYDFSILISEFLAKENFTQNCNDAKIDLSKKSLPKD